MSNIIDKIQLSGVTYDIGGGGGIVSSAITSGDTNAVAGGAVYDKFDEVEQVTAQALNVLNDRLSEDEEVTAAALNNLNEALSGKQDTLSAGTNITIVDNVISAEGGGVDVVQTTGTSTADVMSQDAVTTQLNNKANKAAAVGGYKFGSSGNVNFLQYTNVSRDNIGSSIYYPKINGKGIFTNNSIYAQNNYDLQLVETSAITTAITSSSTNVQVPSAKAVYDAIQEGGGGEVSTAITSGDTNAVAGGAVYDKFDEVEQVTAQALNVLNESLSGKQDTLSAGTNITIVDNVISAEGGGGGAVSSAITSGDTNAVAGGAVYDKFDEVEQVTAAALNNLNEALSGKADSSAVYLKSETSGATELATAFAATQPKLSAGTGISIDANNVISATGGGGGGGTVESAITSGSTNAVESKAIWSATTYNKEVTLQWDNGLPPKFSTNYPSGCKKFVVTVPSNNTATIMLYNGGMPLGGNITINTWGSVTVSIEGFDGITYTISGNDVTFVVPDTITFDNLNCDIRNITSIKAIVEGAWIADSTYMKSEVDAIQNTLQNNINEKLDATAYTPTVVDSSLNVVSTNPVENQALYSELRLSDGGETETTIEWSGPDSTNYPQGCTKIKVEVVGNDNSSNIGFFNDLGGIGTIMINNWGSLSVDNRFDGATYEISGTTVIISYPTVTNVTRIQVSAYGSNYTYKAVTTGAPTALKDQVVENTTALGGLSLVKLTQAQYDALANKDNSTLYVIVG